jgi:plastocyanin
MKRRLLALGGVVAAAAALTTTAFARHASTPTLVGTVGPGYTITLTAGGKKLVRLKAGTYKLVLHDRASIHAWSLDGPNGFAKDLTKVPFVGTKTVTLTLKAGKYKYYCPPHEATMFGHFTAVA